MRSFFQRLTKIHPTPLEPTPKENSPSLNSVQISLSPNHLTKKLSLQTQSFSPTPRPILKHQRKSYINSKHKSLHFDSSERENIIGSDKEERPRGKTLKMSKVVPESRSRRESEEIDPGLRKAAKRREKMLELNNFETKFNQTKLAEKVRKRSMKRSNTMIIREDRRKLSNLSQLNTLQRPSDGVLIHNKVEKSDIGEDSFFDKGERASMASSNGMKNLLNGLAASRDMNNSKNFQTPNNAPGALEKERQNGNIAYNPNLISATKKGMTRKRRTNYRLRYDEKYKDLKFLIFPDDPFRTRWDLLILCFLIYSAIILPFVTAFINEQVGDVFFYLDIFMDAVFFIDVVINLFSADFKDDVLITSHWKIFLMYLKSGWLIIDISSSLPLDIILENNSSAANGFIRIARIPRLYKLLKMTRLVRILKIIKERNKILRYFNEMFKLNSGLERVMISVMLILIFCHIVACLWYILSNFEEDSDYVIWTYMNNLQDLDILDIYVAGLYFTVQTVVTVGYGDLHCYSTYERLFASILMLIGVFVYSFAIGSLTSLMSSVDQKNATYSKSLNILAQIKKEYHLNTNLFTKIKNHLKFGQNSEKNHKKLIDELPLSLRTEVILKIHNEEIQNIPFLQHKPTSFISFLCPLLRRVKINKNDYIFMRNDPAEEMFFIKSGKVAGVLRKYGNAPFLKIKPGYYFGEVDILFYGSIRRYTFMALKDSEFYILSLKHFKKIFLIEFRDTIGVEFVQEAYYRKKRTKKIYLEALALCKSNANKNVEMNDEENEGKLSPMPHFKAKESVYNIKTMNIVGLTADKVLGKKSLDLMKQNEKEQFLKNENDYFFKYDALDSQNQLNSKRNSENNRLITENNKETEENQVKFEENKEEIEECKNLEITELKNGKSNETQENDSKKSPHTKNEVKFGIAESQKDIVREKIIENDALINNGVHDKSPITDGNKLKNFNFKLLLPHSDSLESKNISTLREMPEKSNFLDPNSSNFLPPAMPTPAKKSLAFKTFQKVLNINKLNKRVSIGENLKKAAQKEALKEKIKFFTDRINKMDQDINNLISFSRLIQTKYQEKLELLKPKPNPPPPQPPKMMPLRKIGKTHTLSHINFTKSDSLKKKFKGQNSKPRRKSDTASAQDFLSSLAPMKSPEKNGPVNNKEENLKKIPLNIRLQKVKDEIVNRRRSSLDVGDLRKLERSPSQQFKRKESLLEEGSLVSIEENELKNSMFKIKGKVEKSKQILTDAKRRGSEMINYRGGCSPKRNIGKNLFNSSLSPEKKDGGDLKVIKRTSSIRSRRKSDQFLDLSKNFQRNDSGCFLEKNNKSSKKLSKKLTISSFDEEKHKTQTKNFRRKSENFKASGFSRTLRNLEQTAKMNQNCPTSSSKSSKSSSSGSKSNISNRKSKSSRRSSIRGIKIFSPQIMKLRSSLRQSNSNDSSKGNLQDLSSHSVIIENKNKFTEDEDFIKDFNAKKENMGKEIGEEEQNLIEGIGEELMFSTKKEGNYERKVGRIGKLKFVLDLKK